MKSSVKFYLLIGLLAFCFGSTAQNLPGMDASGNRQLGAYRKDDQHVFSFTGNQAALSRLQHSKLGLYSIRHYLLEELNEVAFACGVKTGSGNFGMLLDYGGYSGYNQVKAGIAYGRKLSEQLSLGLQFNLNSIQIKGYGKETAVSVEAGTIWHISAQVETGFQIRNPSVGKKQKDKSTHWPAIYRFGTGYQVSPSFFIAAVIEKQEDQPVDLICGFQYSLIKRVVVRAGISSSVSTGWFGFGLPFRFIEMELTVHYHPKLGPSPALAMLFNFKPKPN